ncbi:MAG: O-antigen ligase family protein, partial [Desertifilum sp. SIO1I2]|nr:O-antigen ligase family protein [Desertifilum sp. SIO1I2]
IRTIKGYRGEYPLIVLMQYGVIAVSLLLMALRPKTVARAIFRDPFIWALVLTAIVSFAWSDFPSLSLKRGISTLQTAMFGLYLASRYSLKEQLQLVAWAMGIISIFTVLFTGAFPGSGIEQGIHAGAWRGPLVHKNMLARLMAMGTIPTLLVALDAPAKHRRLLWLVFWITLALAVLTTSKTGLLIAFALVALTPLFKALRWTDGVMIPFAIFLVFITTSGVTWLAENWEEFLFGLGKDPTLSGRTYLWEASIDKISQRPWLGYGYQAFWQVSGAAEYVWTAVRYRPAHSHNGFVNLALDLGLVGAFFFVMSLVTIYIRGISWLRITKSSAALWPLLYASFLLLYNQTESTIIEHNNLFWLLHISVTLSIGYVRRLTPQEKADREYWANFKQQTAIAPSGDL